VKGKIELWRLGQRLAAERQQKDTRPPAPWHKQTPCPKCGRPGLVYDGSVIWSNGPRPGRELASKGGFPAYRRADFEKAHYFHCDGCGTNYYDGGLGVLKEE
jgi:hypothetical protein